MIGICRILQFNGFEIGILSRRLVEVAVNANVPHAGSDPDGNDSKTTKECGCSRNANGFENRSSRAKAFSGPFQSGSAEYIIAFHHPVTSLPSSTARKP